MGNLESGPSINTGFFWPTGVYTPNGISVHSAVFAQFTVVINAQTHRKTDTEHAIAIYQQYPHLQTWCVRRG